MCRGVGGEGCAWMNLIKHRRDASPSLAVEGRRWTTRARSPCPSATRTGSSRTATAATGSKWRSRSTWRRSWGKGTDSELETKDGGSLICSIFLLIFLNKERKKSKKKTSMCADEVILTNQWIHFVFLNMYLCMKQAIK